MQKKYGPRGFSVISVSNDESRADAGEFAKAVKATFPVVHDASSAVTQKYGIGPIPCNVVVNKSGKVTKVILGADVRAMDAAVAAALR